MATVRPCVILLISNSETFVVWGRCYLITHAHLDHLNGAVLCAGSMPGPPRKIHATYQTLKDIEIIFSDRLWPNLTTWDEDDHRPTIALIYSE